MKPADRELIEQELEKPLKSLDEWLDTTGLMGKASSGYSELQSIIEDTFYHGVTVGKKLNGG
jgi:hypothetical protein